MTYLEIMTFYFTKKKNFLFPIFTINFFSPSEADIGLHIKIFELFTI